MKDFVMKKDNWKEKIQLSEMQKKRAILIIKIISVCIFFGIYMILFAQGLYKEEDGIHLTRIIIPTIIAIIPSILLFVKIKIPTGVNTIISIIYSAFVIKATFIILQISQGYKYKNFPLRVEALNLLIIFMIFTVFFAIFNSFKGAIIALNIINVVFGLANYFIVMFRGTGLLAVDILNIETATNVASGYSYTLDFYTYLLVISSIAICFLSIKLGKNTITVGWKRIFSIILAICVVLLCYNTFIASDRYDRLLKVKYFKPQETFNKKGMYAIFTKSIKDLFVDEPEGYSIDAVEELAQKYKGVKSKVSKEDAPNIIMIMNEAFTDFSSFTDLKINKDCVPFYHSLEENAIKGHLFVSVFGGGTATTEFEALTSNTMAFVPNGVTVYTTYINEPMSSAATTLKSQDYGGFLAVHPYKGNGYKRDKVYPLLGFDRFITRKEFPKNIDKEGRHVSDVADVEKIISEYEEYKKNNDKPFFLFNVTMQNHSPYNSPGVSDDIKLEYDIDAPEAQQYMNQIKASDDSLKKLVEYYDNVKEPTIIVFFGDHQPQLEDEFYKEVKEAYNLDEVYSNMFKYNAQFVIWANYDIEEQNDVCISANYLNSLVLDVAGLAKSGYEQFVSDVREEVPIITKHGHIGKDGKFYKNDDNNSPYHEILSKYNILEYNNIFDVENRVNSLFEINK